MEERVGEDMVGVWKRGEQDTSLWEGGMRRGEKEREIRPRYCSYKEQKAMRCRDL